ncbi:helix-turn-helix domain-containing protein [Haloprofundus sp. MHR1]|uniref:helix-turn-helix domain-containing protein n=1 Tax=Haloprofundus sp. MHR1 TaxID=2572921 RepID=UPI0010BEF0AD|nr:helix-turn-helix domain-containing protein [Haloprofundus sp. MHR1]QCJ46702.1 bacterio-opsin activator [Haloprofundus sp. MHR1]
MPLSMDGDPDDRHGRRTDGPTTASGLETDRYGLVVEAYLAHPSILLCPTLDAVSEATVRPQSQTTYRGRRTLFFTAANVDYDEFERALVDDPTVDDPTLVGVDPNYRTYRVGLGDSARWPTQIPEALGASVTTAENNSGGWHVRMRLPGRKILSKLSARCRENDVEFRVRQLYSPDADNGQGGATRYGLTDDQQRLLRAAHEMGYYDVPRRSSQNELADRFGVSPSAVSQQLRRGTGTLVGNTLVSPVFDPDS